MIKLNLFHFGGNGSGDGLAANQYETKLSREIGRRSQIKPDQEFVLHNYTKQTKAKVKGDYILDQIAKKKLKKSKGTWTGSKGSYIIKRIEKRRKR